MIDPKLFTVEGLLDEFLDDASGNRDVWRQNATIIPDYMPPHPRPGTNPRCVVEYEGSFLRHSLGPRQGHFWDMYGDDYHNPSLAFIALLQAPIPPKLIKSDAWEAAREARMARGGIP